MIIYNITINIHESAHEMWIKWMENAYIPGILATKKFDKARMVKVLVEEDMGGITYSVQFETKSKELLQQFYKEDFDRFESEAKKLFGELMLTFKTELELVREY
ncbi:MULTISPECIES: DUF4286 family protein [Myroides]|uniref:DUF4286 family protein n=1 Tax=Myroides albus TaxID=2562892 RepID=A0A6I3LER1_9FLAO|nr:MULTISPECIES: DUF4286 family protein [Myroides]MTG97949.1 DUF4286 family protein [Myroides albus]MVX36414.1 DUF4286 family protein [Myroides sp. LoEW2-1]UVD81137.1 DUF4286 family protein [Myroides albus]